ncbi:histidine--tRNA ligase [Candidatus Woesearchaeota archaeon]|nr:histidine--tRNA ligase [Candidatus Woesearchaeota archaeon]
MKLQRARGTRDFLPEKKILRQEIVDTLKSVFESYGFSPIETPILERLDLLSAKYAGGAEILKETFKLKDQGKRDLGLRYDLTVPFARFIGMNPNLKIPFKRYQIGRVFRDGPIKLARYREFWQCDVDIVGVSSIKADAELIRLTQDVFKKLNLDVVIRINSRKILDAILEKLDIKNTTAAILALDKLEKTGEAEVKKELIKIMPEQKAKKLLKEIKSPKESSEIKELLSYIPNKRSIEFTPSLARGLAYYTGTIFEVFLKKSEIKSAVAAGGRYDELISKLTGSKNQYPAVGIAFGLDVIMDAVKKAEKKTVTDVYIIPIQTFKQSLKIAGQLRKAGIKTDIDLIGRGPSKNLNYANAMQIPYVIFIGKDELKKSKLKLRDMKTGKEELLSISEVVETLR